MKGKWFAFGCLSSLVILIVIVFFTFYSLSRLGKSLQADSDMKTVAGSYLHLDLSGNIIEYNEYTGSFFGSEYLAVHDIVHKINKASNDDKIVGILLEPKWIKCGFADVSEIMQALDRFKAGGKKVISYLETSPNKDYLLAAAADEIYMNPSASAGLFLSGVGAEVLFYKDMFDKIGIDFTVLHAGKSKGAGESYSRTGFSNPVKENLELLVADLYENMLNYISTSRNLSIEDTRYIFESRPEIFINQHKAIEYGLVDDLIFKDDLMVKYGIDKRHLIPLDKYKIPTFKYSENRIALVYAQGVIQSNKTNFSQPIICSRELNKILDDIEKDTSVKGIVLRINSPGGSALESEIIAAKLEKLNQIKPVVISMGNVAASGGYYIATESSYIFSDPGTITGSIGVVAMFPNFKDMSDKIGLNNERISQGKYNFVFSPWEKPEEEMISEFRISINNIYDEFKTRVVHGRNLEISQVNEIAEGQVWSSERALQKGLIDEIGSIEKAYQKAAEIAGIEDYTLKIYPKQKSLMEEILKDKFNIDVITDLLIDSKLPDVGIEKLYQLYENVKNEPIQSRLLFEMD